MAIPQLNQYDIPGAFAVGEERGRASRLRELAGQAFAPGADRQAITQQAAQAGGFQGAQQTQQAFQGMDAQKAQQAKQIAEDMIRRVLPIKQAQDPAQKQALFQQALQQAAAEGKDVTPFAKMTPDQAVEAAYSAYASIEDQLARAGMGGAASMPAGIQEFNVLTANLSPEDRAKAQRVKLGLDSRASSGLPYGFMEVVGSDGVTRVIQTNKREGGGAFLDQSGNPIGAATGAQPPAAAPTRGVGIDGIPPQRMDRGSAMAAVQEQEKAQGFPFPVEKRLQMIDGMVKGGGFDTGPGPQFANGPQQPAQVPQAAPGANPYASRTPEDQAARTTLATETAKAQAATQNPVITPAEREDMAARRTKGAQLNDVNRGVQRINKALEGLEDNVIGTGPATGGALGLTEEGQALTKAVDAIQNSMLALTRVPGVGSQSDLEARVAAARYPSINNYASVNKEAMRDLQLLMKDLADAYKVALDQDRQRIEAAKGRQQAASQSPAAARAELPPGFSWED